MAAQYTWVRVGRIESIHDIPRPKNPFHTGQPILALDQYTVCLLPYFVVIFRTQTLRPLEWWYDDRIITSNTPEVRALTVWTTEHHTRKHHGICQPYIRQLTLCLPILLNIFRYKKGTHVFGKYIIAKWRKDCNQNHVNTHCPIIVKAVLTISG